MSAPAPWWCGFCCAGCDGPRPCSRPSCGQAASTTHPASSHGHACAREPCHGSCTSVFSADGCIAAGTSCCHSTRHPDAKHHARGTRHLDHSVKHFTCSIWQPSERDQLSPSGTAGCSHSRAYIASSRQHACSRQHANIAHASITDLVTCWQSTHAGHCWAHRWAHLPQPSLSGLRQRRSDASPCLHSSCGQQRSITSRAVCPCCRHRQQSQCQPPCQPCSAAHPSL